MGCFGSINFTRKQWLITITFIVVNFCNAMCVSMQVRRTVQIMDSIFTILEELFNDPEVDFLNLFLS